MSGRFITIEGPDGAGKSTLASTLKRRLLEDGIKCLLTREPGHGPVGPEIRDILLRGGEIDSWTEVFLFLADRRQHCEFVMRPALDKGDWVLCDRFADSTIVYQGYGRELPIEQLRKLNRIATSGLEPEIILLLDLNAEEGLARVEDKNRLDEEPIEFHRRIREGFLAEARRNPERWRIINASLSPDEVASQALRHLAPLITPNSSLLS